MKYLITESKLDQVIYDYLNELFAAKNGNPINFPTPLLYS